MIHGHARGASVLACVVWATACSGATTPAATPVAPPKKAATSDAAAAGKTGFLLPEDRPDALVMIPPPPPPGSSRLAADVELYRDSLRWRDTPRWRLAASDADVQFPHAANLFSCAAGIRISQSTAPRLYSLLQRVIVDAGKSTAEAKKKYVRSRPFALYGQSTCVPNDEEILKTNGGYPSGHASLGWAWALVLAELIPRRANEILSRGYEFGQSRVICGVHWQTDVDAGRMIASGVVAKLHSNQEFLTNLRDASREISRAPPAPVAGCAAEAAILAKKAPPDGAEDPAREAPR
jgi:acid phosphatase (class A)